QCQFTAQRANLGRFSSHSVTPVTKRNTAPRESIVDPRSRYTGVRTRHMHTNALKASRPTRPTPPTTLASSDRDYSPAARPIIMTMCFVASKAICHIVVVILSMRSPRRSRSSPNGVSAYCGRRPAERVMRNRSPFTSISRGFLMHPCARLLLTSLIFAPSALAQQAAPLSAPAPSVTAADYARAEKLLAWNTAPLVSGATVRVAWLPGDKFWYRNSTPRGYEFVMVDAARHTRTHAFDQERVASALSAAAGRPYDAWHLPFMRFDLSADGRSITFETGDAHRTFTCDVAGNRCAGQQVGAAVPNSVVSPNGKLAAFIRNDNLWVRDLATGTD